MIIWQLLAVPALMSAGATVFIEVWVGMEFFDRTKKREGVSAATPEAGQCVQKLAGKIDKAPECRPSSAGGPGTALRPGRIKRCVALIEKPGPLPS